MWHMQMSMCVLRIFPILFSKLPDVPFLLVPGSIKTGSIIKPCLGEGGQPPTFPGHRMVFDFGLLLSLTGSALVMLVLLVEHQEMGI
jgi:hypothetical protein